MAPPLAAELLGRSNSSSSSRSLASSYWGRHGRSGGCTPCTAAAFATLAVTARPRRRRRLGSGSCTSSCRAGLAVRAVEDAAAELQLAFEPSELVEAGSFEAATARVRIWRTLVTNGEMPVSELADQVGVNSHDLFFHLGHVEKQAQTLKKKSAEWRAMRLLPQGCDVSKVRLQLLPSSCVDCGWEATKAAKKGNRVKSCGRCGSRGMLPPTVRLDL